MLLLHERSVEEVVPQLSPLELEKVIVLVGRSPRLYPRGILEALEQHKSLPQPGGRLSLNAAAKSKPPPLIARDTRLPGPRPTLTKCGWRMGGGLKWSERTGVRRGYSECRRVFNLLMWERAKLNLRFEPFKRRIAQCERACISRRCLVATFYVASLHHGVLAQDQDKPAVALPRTINLTQEQRYIIKENVKICSAKGSFERA